VGAAIVVGVGLSKRLADKAASNFSFRLLKRTDILLKAHIVLAYENRQSRGSC
jgi:hypothetical protein